MTTIDETVTLAARGAERRETHRQTAEVLAEVLTLDLPPALGWHLYSSDSPVTGHLASESDLQAWADAIADGEISPFPVKGGRHLYVFGRGKWERITVWCAGQDCGVSA